MVHLLKRVVGGLRCRAFDWQHGIETCEPALLESLTLQGTNGQHGGFYYPTHPKLVRELLKTLEIDFREYTFIDFGSGKGRVLLAACEFPFRRIIGVEFAEELHQVAEENIRRYRGRSQRCLAVESQNVDAMEFPIPVSPVVLYFFNPFAPAVLTPVLERIRASLAAQPRDAWLVYVYPIHAALIGEPFHLVARTQHYNLYRARPRQDA